MRPGESVCDFVVEEPEADVYNPMGFDPPVWEPKPEDIIAMFQQLETEKVLPLTWVCLGRLPPPKESLDMAADFPSEEEGDEVEKMEEKKLPEPSEFDFDDAASETATRMTPRTPVSAKSKQPEKRMASMDNVLSTLRRQQKAEREARKGQRRSPGTSPFRANTPSRLSAFASGGSPISRFGAAGSSLYAGGTGVRMTGVPSPRGGPPSGSPSALRCVGSPSTSRFGASMDAAKLAGTGSPLNMRPTGSPSNAHSFGAIMQMSQSPKRVGSPAAASSSPYLTPVSIPTMDTATSAQQAASGFSGSVVGSSFGVDVVSDPMRVVAPMTSAGARPNPLPMETDSILGDLGKT